MSTTKFTATTAATVVALIPTHLIGRVSDLTVDNKSTSLVAVRLERVFDPAVSNAVASPAKNVTEEVARMTTGPGLTGSLGQDSLRDVRALGRIQAICDGTWATCHVVVQYSME